MSQRSILIKKAKELLQKKIDSNRKTVFFNSMDDYNEKKDELNENDLHIVLTY